MASNVFCNPITDEALKKLPEYKNKIITRIDRAAAAALKWKDEKKESTNSAYCMLYNATGDTITFVTFHIYYGQINSSIPSVIENGSWGVFNYGEDSSNPLGTSGAVVYRAVGTAGTACDWMVAWLVPGSPGENKVYSEVREAGHYDDPKRWDDVKKLLEKYGGPSQEDEGSGLVSSVKIDESTTSPKLEAILKIAA